MGLWYDDTVGIQLACGEVIAGRYRLDRLLGEGGMGAVWEATHTITRKRTALKFVKGSAEAKPELRRRFMREARAAALVEHPNVITVRDVFELEDATPVMVMDLLEGETLARRLTRERTLSIADAADILLPVVSAVGAAHAMGIVHRDLKPENIFLVRDADPTATVKVLDFGIAKLTAPDAETGGATTTGAMLGTPYYMAPEQCFGESVDHRADVWAIGVILYEVLSGGRPVEGDNPGQIFKRLMSDAIPPLSSVAPDVPDDLAALVGRMLAKDRADRPADLREVEEVLARHARLEVPGFGPPGSAPADDLFEADSFGRASSSRARIRVGATSDPAAPTQEPAATTAGGTAGAWTPPRAPVSTRSVAMVAGIGAIAFGGWMLSQRVSTERTAPIDEPATRTPTSAATQAPIPAAGPIAPEAPAIQPAALSAPAPTPAAAATPVAIASASAPGTARGAPRAPITSAPAAARASGAPSGTAAPAPPASPPTAGLVTEPPW